MSAALMSHFITAWVCRTCGHRGMVESTNQTPTDAAEILCEHAASGCLNPQIHGESMRITLPSVNWEEARRIFRENHK